jgi:hypothetical protein
VNADQLTEWAVANPWPAAITAVFAAVVATFLAVALWHAADAIRAFRFPPAAVLVAAAGALVCTAYSGDTSWRFAENWLDMADATERAAMFAAAELALLACGIMARAHKAATTTDAKAGTGGVPGVLMWLITAVLVIPCYAESGIVGGTVRAVIGPVMAGMLWHLAMGLEIRVARPAALSSGLLPVIGRELRERMLSRLGLATRDRTAEQISRDRATARAVRLASRRHLRAWGRARLAAAVARACVGIDGAQRHRLLLELAARRTSAELRTVPLVSPWASTPVLDEPHPPTPLGVAGAELRRLDPFEVVTQVRAAHPLKTAAEIAALCGEYGVPVSETQVRIATRAGFPPAQVHPEVHPAPVLPELPEPEAVHEQGLLLDLALTDAIPNPMAAPVPVLAADRTRDQVHAHVPDGDVPAELLDRARKVDAEYRRTHRGQPASIRALKTALRIGQPRAEQVRDALAERPTP